jgi:hypothetical protein
MTVSDNCLLISWWPFLTDDHLVINQAMQLSFRNKSNNNFQSRASNITSFEFFMVHSRLDSLQLFKFVSRSSVCQIRENIPIHLRENPLHTRYYSTYMRPHTIGHHTSLNHKLLVHWLLLDSLNTIGPKCTYFMRWCSIYVLLKRKDVCGVINNVGELHYFFFPFVLVIGGIHISWVD